MFYGFVITNDGNNLLNNMVAGEKLTITKVVMEKGTAESAEAARQLTAPIDPGPDGTSTKPTVEGNAVSLIVEYRSDLNGGLNEGFWIGGFAVYGKTDTSAEIMMYYGSLGDKKQYVSAYVSGTAPDVRRYPVSITVKDGIKVDVSYPAEAWMTAEDVADYFNGTLKPDLEGSLKEILEQHDEDQTAHENRFQGKQDNLNTLQAKDNLVDADMVAITDSANNETAKRISWANIKALLNRIFVPLTRTVNNKGLTSDVTLTGADINVSGTDATSISTALSNKALSGIDSDRLYHLFVTANQISDIGLIDSDCTFETFSKSIPARTGMLVVCNDISPAITDIPGYEYGLMLILKGYNDNYRCALYFDSLGGLHYAKINEDSPQNNGWHTVATAEPPQEYTLQAQSGLTANVQYSRSQEGIVVLYADVRKSDSSALGASAITVGTLPVGFRPASTVYASAVALDSSAGAILGAAQIWVSQTGVISMIADPQSGAHRVRGELVFPVG